MSGPLGGSGLGFRGGTVVSTKNVWSFGGAGYYGFTGQNSLVDRSSPTQVGSLAWAGTSCGDSNSFLVRDIFSAFSCGRNVDGQLGLGDVIPRSSPTQIGTLTTWATVRCLEGALTIIGIKTTGSAWTWGQGTAGQLGISTTTSVSSPTQIGTLTTWASALPFVRGALMTKTTGTLWSWGQNTYGTLGLGDVTPRSSPTQVGTGTLWATSMSGCGAFSQAISVIAITTDGRAWTWGSGINGSLGLGAAVGSFSSPTQIGTLTTWARVAGGKFHVAMISTNGTAWIWGLNTNGQLGLGDVTPRSSPTQLGTLTMWASVFCGQYSTFLISTAGTLWSCGAGASGQLGNSAMVNVSSPTQIGTLATWVDGSAGSTQAFIRNV